MAGGWHLLYPFLWSISSFYIKYIFLSSHKERKGKWKKRNNLQPEFSSHHHHAFPIICFWQGTLCWMNSFLQYFLCCYKLGWLLKQPWLILSVLSLLSNYSWPNKGVVLSWRFYGSFYHTLLCTHRYSYFYSRSIDVF